MSALAEQSLFHVAFVSIFFVHIIFLSSNLVMHVVTVALTFTLRDTMGDFTFWISLSLRPSLSPKYGLRPKISEK